MKKHYRVGEVAKLCNVAPRTVAEWFDGGYLEGWRLPPRPGGGGTQDRRITHRGLVRFMRKFGLPLEGVEAAPVLLVGVSAALHDRLSAALGDACRLHSFVSLFLAGASAEREPPAAAVFDLVVGRGEALEAARTLAGPSVTLIALCGEDEADEEGLLSVFSDAVRKPFDPALLAERLLSALGGE